MYCFNFFNFGLGITFYYNFYFLPTFSLYNGIIFVTVP
jgi:hypothetical protein